MLLIAIYVNTSVAAAVAGAVSDSVFATFSIIAAIDIHCSFIIAVATATAAVTVSIAVTSSVCSINSISDIYDNFVVLYSVDRKYNFLLHRTF